MMKKVFIGVTVCLLSLSLSSAVYAGIDWGEVTKKIVKNISKDVSRDKELNKRLFKKAYVAPTTIVYPNGTYYHGQIAYLGKDEDYETEYHRYKLYLDAPTTIKLHFISHVDDTVEFKMIDFDENSIEPFEKRLYIDRSPFTRSVTLNKGEYTFIVYKIRSYGKYSNTGEYRFKFETVEVD